MSNQFTIKIKGERNRVESPGQVFLWDGRTDRLTMLLTTANVYVLLNADDRKRMVEFGKRAGGFRAGDTNFHAKLVATGESRVINGFKTFEYLYDMPFRRDRYWVCLTFPGFREALREEEASFGMRWAENGEIHPHPDEFPGMPIRVESESRSLNSEVSPKGGAGNERGQGLSDRRTIMTLVSASNENLSDSEFVIPPGYSTGGKKN